MQSLEEINVHIGTFIREARQKKKLSQRQLAKLANTSNEQISLYEGVHGFSFNITINTLIKICNALNKDIFQLFAYIKKNYKHNN